MKIGELADKTGCKVETIRFYEAQGLLPAPERTLGNYRDYGPPHLERLQFIRNCRHLDMAHDEIRVLLNYLDQPQPDCSGVDQVIDEHLGHVQRKLAELRILQTQLQALRDRCRSTTGTAECGILAGLFDAVSLSPASQHHLRALH